MTTCPRCASRMFRRSDAYGDYLDCIACGHHISGRTRENVKAASVEWPPTGYLPQAVETRKKGAD